MRRSAAPSIIAGFKKARFLPQVVKNISNADKENECLVSTLNASNTVTKRPEASCSSSFVENTVQEIKPDVVNVRSNEDVLDLIFEADSSAEQTNEDLSTNDIINRNSPKNFKSLSNLKPPKNSIAITAQKETNGVNKNSSNCIFCTKTEGEVTTLFNVVYCKRSGKKHKTWEGDGFLLVKSRSAVLKDFTGKILDKGLGYKLKETESLEEGSKFFIGGKECEIQCKISEEECQAGKYCKCSSNAEPQKQELEKSPVKIHNPC